MKRILYFMAAIAAAISFASCSEDGKPTIEFERVLYTIYQNGSVDVALTVSEPAAADVTVPLIFSGDAVKGTDYSVSAESVTIKAGETAASVKVTNISLTDDKQLTLGFNVPSGYNLGTRLVAVVSPDSQEALVYSFSMTRGYALESYVATINVTGTVSGKDVVTTEDITIPLQVSGAGASNLVFTVSDETKTTPAPAPYAVLKAGETSASVKFTVPDGFSGDDEAVLSVQPGEDRFIAGDNSSVSIAVRGVQTPDKLIGTWKFSKVYDKDELDMWFEEMEDDPEALPTHNEGFTLTFAKESDGSVSVTPAGSGDFMNFFRKATVSLCAPKNATASSIALGKYTVLDNNQFVTEARGYAYQANTYYKVSSANRAFSKDSETLGEAVVVFSLSDDGLTMEFRDYDTPPFGEMWWDDGKFDPDMFGFASLFVKQ